MALTSADVLFFVSTEECVKPADRQDNMASFHTSCSSKEVMGSTSTLQVKTPRLKKTTKKTHYQAFLGTAF